MRAHTQEMSHKRLDKTFSVCDILRIWDQNLTAQERDEVVFFFSVILSTVGEDFSTTDLLGGALQGPWGPLTGILEKLGRSRAARRLSRLEVLESIFKTPGTAQCVHELANRLRLRSRIA